MEETHGTSPSRNRGTFLCPLPCWIRSATRRCCGWPSWMRSFRASKSTPKPSSSIPAGRSRTAPALNMILDGERTGRLTHDRMLLDATSGNTGIAYAMICALKGYKVKLCLPANASHERKQILKGYGAEMVFSDPGEGSDGAIRLCRKFYEADPDAYFYPDQYNNPANWKAHFDGTAVEIIEQTARRHHALRHLHGHQRNLHGKQPAAEARRPGRHLHFRAAVLRIPRPGRLEAHADGHRSRHLRSRRWPTIISGSRPRTPIA